MLIIGYSLGLKVDMRKATAFFVGALFVVIGSCLPTYDRIKIIKETEKKQ